MRLIAHFLLLLFGGVVVLAVWLFVPLSDMEYIRVSQERICRIRMMI